MGTGRETTPALAVEATGSVRRRAAHAANRARREPRAVIPARAFEAISFQQKRADVSRYAPVRGGVALDDGPRGVRPEFGLLGDDRIERGVARERRADRGGRGGLDRDAARVRRSACADAQSRRRESASFAGDSLRAGAGRRGGRDVPEGVNHGRLHALLWLGYTRERARVSHAARSARPGRRPERRRPIVRVKKVLESSKDRKARRRSVPIRRGASGISEQKKAKQKKKVIPSFPIDSSRFSPTRRSARSTVPVEKSPVTKSTTCTLQARDDAADAVASNGHKKTKDDGNTSVGRARPSQPPMAPPNAPPPEAVDLVEYLNEAWTPYHAVLASCKRLMAAGFEASPRARPSFRLSRSRTTFLFCASGGWPRARGWRARFLGATRTGW